MESLKLQLKNKKNIVTISTVTKHHLGGKSRPFIKFDEQK